MITVVAYLPALRAQINIFDDHDYILDNPWLGKRGGLWKMWADPRAVQQYYPLTYTTYWLEYQLWGLRPVGYHAVNILLHCTAALLLWRLLGHLAVPGAWWAAAIFAVHPVCVESVAWVAEQKNTLSMTFALASMLCYLRFAPADFALRPVQPAWRQATYYVLALLLFAAGMLSKTAIVTLPAVLIVVYWWKRGRFTLRDVAWLTPFFALGACMGLATAWLEVHVLNTVGADWAHGPVDKVLIAGRALWFYAGKLAWPYPLIHFYPQWQIDPSVWWQYLFPLAALATIAALWFAQRRIGRGPLAAVLIFAGVLAPGLGFFKIYFMRHTYVSDHFQYHACVALIALAVAGTATAVARLSETRRTWAFVAASALVVACMALSFAHARHYENMAVLQQDVIDKNPTSWVSYLKLGIERWREDNPAEAVRLLREAVRQRPDEAFCQLTLAHFLIKSAGVDGFQPEEFDEIVRCFEEGVRLEPRHLDAHYGLAMTRMLQQRPDLAIAPLEKVLEIDPTYYPAQSALGGILAERGDFAAAVPHLQQAVELAPNRVDRLNRLASALLELGEVDRAGEYLAAAERLQPDAPETRALRAHARKLKTQADSPPRN